MKVGELRKILKEFDDDLVVIVNGQEGDYDPVLDEDIFEVDVVLKVRKNDCRGVYKEKLRGARIKAVCLPWPTDKEYLAELPDYMK